jgi:urease accessory protein
MNSKRLFALACAAAFAAVASTPAAAHVGIGSVHGFANGLHHPLSGIDHMLAMFAVGMFAANLGGRALWLVPASFVAMMAVGGALGIAHVALPYVEIGIAASVIVLGAAVAFRLPLPTIAAMLLVGFFAVFHGHAHGSEMPAEVAGATYAAGFMVATALLHAIGIGTGLMARRMGTDTPLHASRIGGMTMSLAGVALLAGWI